MPRTVKADEIYAARNQTKIQKQIYMQEAIFNLAQSHAEKIFGGRGSASLFVYASTCVILGKLGHKLDFFDDEDHRNIKVLHKCIADNK